MKKLMILVMMFFFLLISCTTPKARLTINTYSQYLLINEKLQLEVKSDVKKDEMSFKSSDETIAIVDADGFVTGVSEGEVIIIITSEKGGYLEVKIQVIKDYIPDRIEIINTLNEYYVEGGTYRLEAKAYPEYKLQEFKWEVAGTKATIDASTGEITFLEEGEVYVICRSKLNNNILTSTKLKVVHKPGVEITRILFIGNSLTYVNDIPKMVKEMARITGKAVYCDDLTVGGSTLKSIYTDQIVNLTKLLEKIQYDYVILQEQSYSNFTDLESFRCYAIKLSEYVKSYGAKEVLLYQTWAYKDGSNSLKDFNLTREDMQNKIINAYADVSQTINAKVNPVGKIFYEFSLVYPGIELYMDDNHASLAGSYLSSCVHYACIFNERVSGNKYEVNLDPQIIEAIQIYVDEFLFPNEN